MAKSSEFVAPGLHVTMVALLLAFSGAQHLGILLAAVYAAVFAGFCYVSRMFTTSLVTIPWIAVKLQLKFALLLIAYAARGFQPTFPEWTLAFELTISMTRYIFVEYSSTIVHGNTSRVRDAVKQYGLKILKPNCRQHNTVPEKLVVNGMEHTWLRDADKKQHHVVVIHYHGGGYCISDPLQDVEFANQTHTKLKQILKSQYHLDVSVDVLLANYRMAPEFLYPTALNDCFDMYKYVLQHESIAPNHVVFSGDSAGAEMSMTNCMRLRKESPELQPVAALCYSPVVDFNEVKGDEESPYCLLVTNFLDVCLPLYLHNVTDAEERRLVSPINNCLVDLPPMFVQWGSLERFYAQAQRFKAKAETEGVTNMEFDFLENMVHDVVVLPPAMSPSAEMGIHHGCEFAARHLAPVLHKTAKGRVDPESEP
ncbi:hypothetical protein PRIC2_002220 [Phytophthora ramorum]